MCGISGWFDTKTARSPDKAVLRAMNDAIAHRGPDGEGFFFAPGIGLGHRRLAIIDPVARRLSAQAEPRRAASRSCSMARSIISASCAGNWRRWAARSPPAPTPKSSSRPGSNGGEASVTRLTGQFAFALWDGAAQSLHLVRDRLGEKPLYYSLLDDGGLIFGSELKALLAHPRCRRAIDPQSVEDFFALGYIAEPRSIYADVKKVPAGGPYRLPARRPAPPRAILDADAQSPRRQPGRQCRRTDRAAWRLREGADGVGRGRSAPSCRAAWIPAAPPP